MKKIYVYLSILLAMLCTRDFLPAQVFSPGAEWFYTFKNAGLAPVRGYTHYRYTGDTVILSQTAKKVEGKTYFTNFDDPGIVFDTTDQYPIFFNQSANSIRYFSDGTFKLLWKLGLQAGDSYQVAVFGSSFYTVTVDSTANAVVDGQTVKKTWVKGTSTSIPGGTELIYDNFGPSSGFFYAICWALTDCNPPSLCRYGNNLISDLHFNGSNCDNITSASQEPSDRDVKIFPNPCGAVLQLETGEHYRDAGAWQIVSQTGAVLKSAKISAPGLRTVDMADVAPGVHYCRVLSKSNSRVFKLIKYD